MCDCVVEKLELRLLWVLIEKKVVGNLELLEFCEYVLEVEMYRV